MSWLAENRYRRTAVWVLFVLWTGFIFLRQQADDRDRRREDAAIVEQFRAEAQANIERVERESNAQAYILCRNSNEARAGIRNFVETLVSGDGVISEREQAAIDLAEVQFAEQECPPAPTQEQTDAAEEGRGS